MHQPCPDCGTLMWNVNDLFHNKKTEALWHCPACGQTWTDEQIQEAYKLLLGDDQEEADNG